MYHGHVQVATTGIKGKTIAEARAAPFQSQEAAKNMQQSSGVKRQGMEEGEGPRATSEWIGVVSYGHAGFCPNLPIIPLPRGKGPKGPLLAGEFTASSFRVSVLATA